MSAAAETGYRVPLLLRGEIVEGGDMAFGGRRGGVSFTAPDVAGHLGKLVLSTPSRMADIAGLPFAEIERFLAALGERLDPATNPHLAEAFALACHTSGLSRSLLVEYYRGIPGMLQPDAVRDVAERMVGLDYLNGWVEQPRGRNRHGTLRIRAVGSRAVHIIAGNVPVVGVATVLRNAITRSDAIIKTPSNDPLTAAAIVRTMIELDPGHPITRHTSVAYWKGGDARIEDALYDPRRIEKIVAWGGFAGIRHLTQYLQPGLDLITLDPKHSSSLIGPEAFADEATLHEVALRLALDIGTMNQEGCVNARVIYVLSGTDPAGLERANRLGAATYAALQRLPDSVSTPHKAFDRDLREEIAALAFVPDAYRVFGGQGNEGALIVSQDGAPVDFARQLACRVGNIVPIDRVEEAILSVNAYTQTIGIYPDRLKAAVRDRLAWQGAQRLVSLGGAGLDQTPGPQDGIEPLRRMVKWITDEDLGAETFAPFRAGQEPG
ncbi:acyl-CoA reductase [Novosphingobium sp.]|uniref:acyl-CoA reductase n=1 Tax=Novosphingobium sp. TaxID=1874826 RepID=UPI002637FD0D|nr:acyl-CoA reductase [Novosphingobium sp.]